MSDLTSLINSGCDSDTGSISYGPLYGLDRQNNVYERVQALVDLAVNIGPLNVGSPTFRGEVLPTDVGSALAATLEQPVHADLTAPANPTLTLPSDLAAPGYTALRQFTDLGHFSPVLTSVQWASPVEALVPSSQAAPAPDLNYPADNPESLPTQPALASVDVPDIVLHEVPDLVRLEPVPFDIEDLQPLTLSALPTFTPPDVAEMSYRPLSYYQSDSEYRDFLGEILERRGPLGEWASSFSYDLLMAQQLRFQRQQIKRGLDEVFEAAGARNVEVASGAVDQAASILLQDRVDESIKASDAVRDEVYQQALELVKQAVSGAITVERYRGAAYVQYVKQNVEIYRLNIQAAKQLLDELTKIVQVVAQDVGDQVQAYNLYVDAQMAQTAGAIAAAEFVLSDVRNFVRKLSMVRSDAQLARAAARIDALAVQQSTMPLRTYRAMLSGVSSQLNVVRNGLASWGEAIRAHSEYTEAQVRQLDGVDTYASAVTSAVRVNDANVSSYRRVLGAEQDRMQAFEQYLSANTAAFDAELGNFREAVQSEMRRLEALRNNLETSAQVLDTYRGVATSTAQHAAVTNQAKAAYQSASDSVDATVWDVSMAQQSLSAELVSQYARLDVGKRAIDIQAAAALSQSAASIFQVSLSMSGDSRERVSAQIANSQQINVGRSVQWSKGCSDSVRTITRPVFDNGT